MKKYLSILTVLFFTTYVHAQAVDTLQSDAFDFTLEECIQYALQNNYDRQSAELDRSAQEMSYQQSKVERWPNVSASASQGLTHTPKDDTDNSTVWTGSYGVNANMTLYNGGTINQTVNQNKLMLEQIDYQNKQYDNQLTINIIQAFLSVIGNDELLKYQETLLKTSEEQLQQGKDQLSTGAIIESDYLLLEAQYATNKYNVINTEITRNNNMLNLKNLLSLSPAQTLNVIAPDTTLVHELSVLPPLEEVIQISLQTLPDLQIGKYNVSIAQTSIKLSQSGFYPKLTLGAGIGSSYNGRNTGSWGTQFTDNFNEQVSLTLSIPIFSNNRNKTNTQQSKIRLQQAELQFNQTELSVMQQVEQEYQNVVGAYQQYIAAEMKQKAYKASFDAYSRQFDLGVITAVDLLLQQNNYIGALNDYIQGKYSLILERKILDIYMDNPIKL